MGYLRLLPNEITLEELLSRIALSNIRDKQLASEEMVTWYSTGDLSDKYNNSRWARVLRTIIPESKKA